MSKRIVPSKARRDTAARFTHDVMNAEQAAEFLGVNVNTLYRAAARAEVPCKRIGKIYTFSRSALLAWIGQMPAKSA